MLSVIVPVYNAEKHLNRCLTSLLNQGVDDYEIICVNDGSTDGSLAILRGFKRNNPSVIKIVEQKNSGVFAARNTGMLFAQGDVLAFCDADDYLIPHAYGFLMGQYWKEDIDVLRFDSVTLDKYVLKSWKESGELKAKVVYEGDGYGFYKRAIPCFVWNFLYRKSFLIEHKVEFRPLPNGEDTAFNLDVFIHNPRTLYINANLYRYTVSEGQLTRQRSQSFMRKAVDGYLVLFEMMNAYSKQVFCMKATLDFYKEQQMIPCISRILSANYSRQEWKALKKHLLSKGGLPMRQLGIYARVINILMSSFPNYKMSSVLYRNVFLPFVLPHLRRN